MVKYIDGQLDGVFAALADPVRRKVTLQLTREEQPLSQLAEPYAMSLPAFMKHIAVLEKSGLVRTEKRGRVRYCRLEPKPLREAQNWLAQTADAWVGRLASLQKFLEMEGAE